jgi:hypothetical protein
MAATWKWYGNGLLAVAKGLVDFDTDTFKIMLTTSAYTPVQNTHDYRDDVTNEVAASGTYATGGATLAGVTVTQSGGVVSIGWTPDPSFTSATITARTAVIYKARGGAASADELVAYATETGDVTSTAGTFTIDLPAPVLTLTAAA